VKLTLKEIALFLGGTIIGDDAVIIENIRPMDEAGERDITFLANKKYAKQLKTTGARQLSRRPD